METFQRLCNWFGVHPALFFTDQAQAGQIGESTVDRVTAILFNAPDVPIKTAQALVHLLKESIK